MVSYSTNEFRAGLKIMLDGDPCSIVENEFVKPGKGQAFSRVKVRNLKTGRIIEKTFRSGETVAVADVLERDLQYLYSDGEYWHFMDEQTFEQVAASADVVADVVKWLKTQDVVQITLWNGVPLSIMPPNHVELVVTEADPGVRGDTATGASKLCTVETGAVIKVPLFVEVGDKLKIDTRTGEYISRT